MKILISGDTHGSNDTKKLSNDHVRTSFGSLPDVLIVAGDFAVPWSNDPDDPTDNYLRRWYEEKPYKVLVVPGNHENYDRIEQLSEVEIFGAKAYQYGTNIFYIKKNEILTIDGVTFYCFGGAMSCDKEWRVSHTSWWAQEDATWADCQAMMEKVERFPKVDFVITHTCPSKWVSLMPLNHHTDDNCPTRKALDWLDEHLKYKMWFFGHFHMDMMVTEKSRCLYNKLVMVDLDAEK